MKKHLTTLAGVTAFGLLTFVCSAQSQGSPAQPGSQGSSQTRQNGKSGQSGSSAQSGGAVDHSATQGHDTGSTSANRMKTADNAFATKAAVGGLAEVQFATLAKDHAASADVKSFAQRMYDDHSKANDELKQFASTKGITLPTSLDAKHQATYDRLSKLNGAEFDKAYMKDMVADHREDVSEFRKESNSGSDPELKAWAAKTLPTLEEHLKLAESTNSKVK
jgi:putative membrane protein